MTNAKITALPANPIAGPVKTKIAPPIMAAIPIITMSKRFNDRTSLCSWGCVGVAGCLISEDINF
jgi:hypothetical protein